MYLDSKGLVTIGVGIFLPNIDSALKIKFRVESGRLATKEEIEKDFNAIKTNKKERWPNTIRDLLNYIFLTKT